jgi:hypothetical protein
MIAASILACEAAFWVMPIAGLTAGYRLGRHRLSTALLVCVPLDDIALARRDRRGSGARSAG